MKIDLILLCAGKSERFGTKQKPLTEFKVNGVSQPIWWITYQRFEKFSRDINEVFMVIPKDDEPMKWVESVPQTVIPEFHWISGGETRNESIINAVKQSKADYVIIHDGVRPFVTLETIAKCIYFAEKGEHAIFPLIPADFTSIVDNTITGDISKIIDRVNLKMLVTPMVFHKNKIEMILRTTTHTPFLDISHIYDLASPLMVLFPALRIEKYKLTYPEDKVIFQALFDNGVFL